jgi:hypothetical protein
VAFWSAARNLAPGHTLPHSAVYVRDLHAGTTELVGIRPDGTQIPAVTAWPSISNDGRFVVFEYYDGGPWQVMLRDRWAKTLEWVSFDPSGVPGDANSYRPRISGDGKTVVFGSAASGLVPEAVCPSGLCDDVYVYEVGRPASAFTLKPAQLEFGEQLVGTATTRNFWLRNRGTTPLNIAGIGLRGSDRAMFLVTHGCGVQVAVDHGCAIRVTFRPTSGGGKTARLRVETDVYEVRIAALTGMGVNR